MSRLTFAVGLVLFAWTPLLAQPVKRADLTPGLVFAALFVGSLLIAGSLKILYDLLLLRGYQHHVASRAHA